jgi:hypothetical protein
MGAAKFKDTGELVWEAKNISDAGSVANAMCLDANGFLWVGGSDGEGHSFMYQLNLNGNVVQAQALGPQQGAILSIRADASGNVIQHWAQAPIANFDSYGVAHNNTLTVASPGVLANDTFSKGATAILHSAPTHGSLTLQPGGAFTYKPTLGFVGTDTFQYTAGKSAGGGSSNIATVTIHVS